MFEKEAKAYKEIVMKEHLQNPFPRSVEDVWQDGAEFGYNKANEWHYMKDVNCYEDLPQNKYVYYAYVVNVGAYDKPTIERRLGCFADFEFDVMAYHVIAWKEIVLPELKENE